MEEVNQKEQDSKKEKGFKNLAKVERKHFPS
jgi:hypothetical protein